jgi:cytochrome c oxidase subunit III
MIQRTFNASHLPDYSISTEAPLWWGQLLLAAIEGTTFCILIAMYFYIRLSVDIWPPPGIRFPSVTLPTIALIPLILSAFGSYWASEGAKKNDRAAMLIGLIVNIILGVTFIAIRAYEWRSLNFTWASDIHGSLVWTILFLHTVDAVADLIFTVVLVIILTSGRYGPKQRLGVHVDSIVWYFIVLIWLPLYVVIYWGPTIVGGGK